jgi:hypothetical protein
MASVHLESFPTAHPPVIPDAPRPSLSWALADAQTFPFQGAWGGWPARRGPRPGNRQSRMPPRPLNGQRRSRQHVNLPLPAELDFRGRAVRRTCIHKAHPADSMDGVRRTRNTSVACELPTVSQVEPMACS